MMRRTAASVILVLVLALPGWSAAPAAAPACIGADGAVTVEATPVALQPFIEVPLLVRAGERALRLDPSRAVLDAGGARLASLTPAQAKSRIRDVGGHIMALILGPLGVAATMATQVYATRAIDARALRVQDIPAGGTVRGSLFFPTLEPAPRRARLTVFLAGAAGEIEVRLGCPVLAEPSVEQTAADASPVVTTLALVSRSEGPVRVSVAFAEFSPEATVLDAQIENPTEHEADLFAGLAGAVLQAGGIAYPILAARSDLIERLAARGTVRVRLMFPPLPRPGADWQAVLLLPIVRAGGEEREVRVELAR